MYDNIIEKIVNKQWQMVFSADIIKHLNDNFTIMHETGFMFKSLAYISIMNYKKNMHCQICNSHSFQSECDYFFHISSTQHSEKYLVKYMWLLSGLMALRSYHYSMPYISGVNLFYQLDSDRWLLHYLIQSDYNNLKTEFYV